MAERRRAAGGLKAGDELADGLAGLFERIGQRAEGAVIGRIESRQVEPIEPRVDVGQFDAADVHPDVAVAVGFEIGDDAPDVRGDLGDVDYCLKEAGVVLVDGGQFEQGDLAVAVVVEEVAEEPEVREDRQALVEQFDDRHERLEHRLDVLDEIGQEAVQKVMQFQPDALEADLGQAAPQIGEAIEVPVDVQVRGEAREDFREGPGIEIGLDFEMDAGGRDAEAVMRAPRGIDDPVERAAAEGVDLTEGQALVRGDRSRVADVHIQPGGEERVHIRDADAEDAQSAVERTLIQPRMHADDQFRAVYGRLEEEALGRGEAQHEVERPADLDGRADVHVDAKAVESQRHVPRGFPDIAVPERQRDFDFVAGDDARGDNASCLEHAESAGPIAEQVVERGGDRREAAVQRWRQLRDQVVEEVCGVAEVVAEEGQGDVEGFAFEGVLDEIEQGHEGSVEAFEIVRKADA